jgi:hypothetical protein
MFEIWKEKNEQVKKRHERGKKKKFMFLEIEVVMYEFQKTY